MRSAVRPATPIATPTPQPTEPALPLGDGASEPLQAWTQPRPRRGPVPASQGIVYCSADIQLPDGGRLLSELGLEPRAVARLAMVDVKCARVFILSTRWLADPSRARAAFDLHGDLAALIVVDTGPYAPLNSGANDRVAAWLEEPIRARPLRYALRVAFRQIELQDRARKAQLEIDRRATQLADLHHVGVALSAVHDVDALQTLILTKARAITSADAGSLYLVQEEDEPSLDDAGNPLLDADGDPITHRVKVLAFNKSQNFSNPTDFKAFRMPLDAGIAGYVATTGAAVHHEDIYHLPPDARYTFNDTFDRQTGYRSKSMLAVPMANSDGQVIGVIQLINRKYRPDVRVTASNIDREVIPFSLEDRDLTLSFASQAAVALDNKRLIDSIQTLFEGFVTASVQAIESRDPTTSGHSGRVATLTVGLAEAINGVGVGSLRRVRFEEASLREIRYAAVLHDFGKVGVREHVLVKSKKLYDWQIEQIRGRFGVARAALESAFLRRRLDYVLANGPKEGALAGIDREFDLELAKLEASFELVRLANEPSVLTNDCDDGLREIGELTYAGLSGAERLIEPGELRKLSIKRGSLDEAERLEIESHVTHTYKFLTKIPWTYDLRHVPEIAWAHHERLDGTGYPNGLLAAEIPIQSKLMAICDIYDALTAWDRPYKRAVPVDKALDILTLEASEGHIDRQLLDIFIGHGVYKLTARDSTSA